MSRKFNAMLGLGALAAFGFASSAFAQCPSSPVPPWSGQTQTQGAVAIVAGGYDGTSCKMSSVLNAGASSFASAIVRDDTPSSEPRYRAQFLIDADALTGLSSFQGASVFAAQAANTHLSSNVILRIAIRGGASKALNFIAADENGSGGVTQGSVPLAAGVNRVEFDLTTGASGQLKVWINATGTSEPAATITLSNLNNAAWGGVDAAGMGLSAANSLFRTSHGGRAVFFDEFDSRRQTYIGQ